MRTRCPRRQSRRPAVQTSLLVDRRLHSRRWPCRLSRLRHPEGFRHNPQQVLTRRAQPAVGPRLPKLVMEAAWEMVEMSLRCFVLADGASQALPDSRSTSRRPSSARFTPSFAPSRGSLPSALHPGPRVSPLAGLFLFNNLKNKEFAAKTEIR